MKKIVLALFVVALAGCDSGGSSSGSSAQITESNTTSPENIGAQYAGTYRGTLEGTYVAPDLGLSDSDSVPVRIVIDNNGNTTVTVDGRSYSGSLDSDRIVAVVNISESYDDISCTGRINVNARISGNTIRGDANGAGRCNQGSTSTPVQVAGVLNASR